MLESLVGKKVVVSHKLFSFVGKLEKDEYLYYVQFETGSVLFEEHDVVQIFDGIECEVIVLR